MTERVKWQHLEGRGPWMGTFSGVRFYPMTPRASEVKVVDIAQALANRCRYSGLCKSFYSVAQHSVIVSMILLASHGPLIALHGLLHDAAETYVGDMIRPLKLYTQLGELFQTHEQMVHDAIMEKFGLPTGDLPSVIKEVDDRVLATEAKTIVTDTTGWTLKEPYDFIIDPVGPEQARDDFMRTFESLWGMLHDGASVLSLDTLPFPLTQTDQQGHG